MTYSFTDFVGNIGVIIILLTYLLLQLNKIDSRSLKYSSLNSLGSLLVIVSLYFEFNLSAFIIEFFWLLISLFGIYKAVYSYNNKTKMVSDST